MSDLKTNLQEILQEKQNKIVPENIKKDVQIFDVTGTYECSGSSGGGDVKLFETEEEMQADSTAQEGDLAVVYREEIQNMTADTQTQYITFPETVVLPEAMTNSVYCMLRAVDESVMFEGQVSLNANRFSFSGYTETGMIRVMYESSDGITYTRTSFSGGSGDLTNPVDLGTVVGVYSSEEWNDNFGYFMQIGGMTFDGLYKYSKDEKFVDKNYYAGKYYNTNLEESDILIKNINIDYDYVNSLITFDAWKKDFNIECKIITDWDVSSDGNINYIIPKEFYAVYGTRSHTSYWKQLYLNDNKIKIGISSSELPSDVAIPCLHYNNGTYSVENWMPVTYIQIQFYEDNPSLTYTIDNHFIPYNKERGIIIFNDYIERGQASKSVIYDGINRIEYWDMYCNENGFSESDLYRNYYSYKYLLAPNQYTLTSSNQLLPNISAYGKNGNVIGDGSIYDNLDLNAIWSNILNISTPISDIADGYKLLSDNISSNKLFSGIINAEAKNYMCKTSSTGVPLGNIFGVSSEYVVVGVGTNLIYYSKRRWDSDIIVYSYNTSTFEIKTYNIPYTKENYDAYVSATNGYIYVGYITDYPQGSNGWVYKVTVSALDTNTNEYTQLYTNTLVKSSTMDMYAINGIALVMHHYISNYSVIRVNAAEHDYGNFLPDYTGWSSSYQSCYSLDGNIIYMPGIYNNSSSNRMVYDKSSNLDAYYTDSSTSVTGWATERLIPNYGNKYILGIKQHTSSDTDKLIIYNRSSHTITANDLGTDFLSSSDKWIAIKNNILYLEQYQINLDTYKVTKSHFLHSTYYLPTISNDNNLIVGNAPSIAGKYIVKSTPIDIGSIDLTKKPDFIFSYPYTNNSASNNIPILVDNTEKDYSATISPEEYNTALDTSEQILGEEETANE